MGSLESVVLSTSLGEVVSSWSIELCGESFVAYVVVRDVGESLVVTYVVPVVCWDVGESSVVTYSADYN